MKILIDRPIATLMIFLVLLVLGIYSFLHVPLELAPKEEFPQLDIVANWSDVPPEIIQSQVTAPIEEKVSVVKGVRKVTSSSSIGQSRITVEFDPQTNMEFARLALREKIAELKNVLPYGVRPRIEPYVPEDFRVNPFLHYTISGNYTLQELREMVKDKFELGIGAIKGVASVEVTGGAEPLVRVILNKEKLKSLDIHPYLVLRQLQDRARIYPAGKVNRGDQEFLFKVANPIYKIRDLREIIVAKVGGVPVQLKEIAQVYPSFSDIYYINRINGQPTVRLIVRKERGTSTLKVARAVKARLEEIKKTLPPDLVFRVVDDEAKEIHKNLRELYLLVAIIVSVIFLLVLAVLRRVQPSLLVLSSIFFSIMITFNLIYIFKISINMLTLGGLALGFGLFVDNSIVVFENILRYKERGFPAKKAALQGAREVFLPVLASTLTTVSVFFSFAYFQGRLKIYYLPLAIVISAALTASLVVSFTLIPSLSPYLLKERKAKLKARWGGWYVRGMRGVLRFPVVVLLFMVLIFYGSYRWFRSEVTIGEWFRWYSKERLLVSIGMPPGTEITTTDEVVRKFEERILQKPYEKEVNSSITAERATIVISFPPEIEHSYRPYVLKEELIQMATNFAGISIGIYGFDPQSYYSSYSTGVFYDSQIKFYGYNLKKLKEITSALEKELKKNPRIKEVRIVSSRYGWWRLESFEYVLKIDKEKLKKFDVDPNYLYFAISTALRGRVQYPLRMLIGSREQEISIKYPEAAEIDLKDLQDVLIMTNKGEYLRLGEISFIEERPIAGSIDRENQKFQQIVMWEFRGPYKAAENYKKAVFANLQLPPGFSASLEDTRWMTTEEKSQLRFAIIFSLVIIFMILASLYESLIQPFFILLAVPLALIGVFVAFVLADFPFDSSAYVGVILLGGIVVNNSILLVDHINLKRKQGLELRESILEGARERIRPIFMTTSTTVLGMLPLVLIHLETGQRQIWSSLALSTVGGLMSSTLFILLVIPVFYSYGERISQFFRRKMAELIVFSKKL
jgi:HAE1 family hydrophobic/amphiphilic exporter-1